VLGLMITRPHVCAEMIQQRLDVSSDAKVAKHRLQKALDPWGIKIQCRRGLGYWLSDADKQKVIAMTAEKPQEGSEGAGAEAGEAPELRPGRVFHDLDKFSGVDVDALIAEVETIAA
jgi:biotin operon repressor